MLRALLITSKSPYFEPDQDGGSMFAAELCRNVNMKTDLDILFVRRKERHLASIPTARNVFFISAPTFSGEARFEERIRVSRQVADWLRDRIGVYDLILVQHVSNGFGLLELRRNANAKVVVFPMFTGISYRIACERVPNDYMRLEGAVLNMADAIVCPSKAEIEQLVAGYSIERDRATCVPRGVNLSTYKFCSRELPTKVSEILYVASIKRQKNQMDALAFLFELNRLGIHGRLHFVGAEEGVYRELVDKRIMYLGLTDSVIFHGVVSPSQVSRIASGCHLAISVSNWETFGRNVFEALAMGLPSIVYEDLACIWEYVSPTGACGAVKRCPISMACYAADLLRSPDVYMSKHQSSRREVEYLAEELSMRKLLAVIGNIVEGASCKSS